MACIKGASRSASVAFSPDSPYLAAGTMAGAVDLSFSSLANLEVFKLDFQSDEWELPVVGECPSSERFNRLSWGKPGPGSKEYELGLIAGGLADGSINIWNPLKLISSKDAEGSLVASLQKHTGPVHGLEFNINSPNLLASGADDGELCIWDLSNPAEPSHFPPLKGVGSGAQVEVSFLAWNHKVQHILASTSYNGTTVVWDLKRQKPVISFSDSIRRRCSVLQWNPDVATQLIVASDDDRFPSLRVWDMRNTISPMKEFVGHSKGVIAMSWCPNDGNFLLTCAKDNRTLCWDTSTGEIVSELPASTNWNFDIHWYPKIPGIISASSFDGKVGIYNIEACSRLSSAETDFGSASVEGSPVHFRAPKWLKCPVGVDFGFGGKLASFRPNAGAPGTSEVHVHNLVTETSLVNRSTEFDAAMRNGDKGALRALCETKSQEAESEDDKETWGFLKVMFDIEGIARTELRKHLGFAGDTNASADSDDLSKKIEKSLSLDEHVAGKADADASLLGRGIQDTFLDNGEDFFNNLESPKAEALSALEGVVSGDASVSNGEKIQKEAGLDESSESSLDEAIQHSLIIGDYKEAVSRCISANRMADALVISHWSGLWETTRDQYLNRSHSSYIKVFAALVGNDLLSLVNTRPLSSWKETLALLCTYARGEEWSLLCDTLASRLMVGGYALPATLCYICAGNIDKTVEVWTRNLKDNHNGKSYVDHLQDLMEKTVVLALATEQKHFSTSLTKLVENYAELLASQGLLTTAMEYLKLLRTEGTSHELAILQDRIAFAMEEREGPKTLHFDSTSSQQMSVYGNEQTGFDRIDATQQYYQDNAQPQSPYGLHSNGQDYQQPFATSYGTNYHPAHSSQQFQDYTNQSFQSAGTPQMFIPHHVPQAQQMHYAPSMAASPAVRPFNPAPPPAVKHTEQYQQPTLASHLYPGNLSTSFQAGMPRSISHGAGASQPTPFMPSQIMTPALASKGFVPVTSTGFVQRSSQPSSPTKAAEAQPTATSSASTQSAPPAVETVDTSNVSAQMRPVIETLKRLYEETSRILGAPNAVMNKKREIDDNSRRLGSLFAKLNSGDISANVATKLVQLCQALDKGDFSGALHIQVLLTTSDWDECNFWLSPLKRMIKLKQNAR